MTQHSNNKHNNTKKDFMTKQIYQIKISLKGFTPMIWRRILIPSDLLLYDFHRIIQTTMGWTNSHLHQFVKNRTFFSVRYPDDDFWNDARSIDYVKKKIRVSDLLTFPKDRMIYEYDFGDGWEHNIVLEKILPFDNKKEYPVCVAGKMSCPPEDCGGVWGYANMLGVLKQPDHEEYEDIVDWIGEDFNPEHFDIDEVNLLLKTSYYGCPDFF